MNRLILLAALGLSASACQPKGMYALTTDHTDNDRATLVAALGKRQLPEQPVPQNSARQPRVFVVQAGSPRSIVAYDLSGFAVMWKVDAEVQSRIWVGGDALFAREGNQLVARDQKTGRVTWKRSIGGQLVGAAADRERAYVVTREGSDRSPIWYLTAYDARSGDQVWQSDPSTGQLGAPAAQGGLVYSPLLTQWLIVVDGKTGAQLARLRGVDEAITMVRATSRETYFGSRQGVFVLDARAAAGKRDQATYGQAKVPPQLERTTYGVDLYDPAQVGYTAADRSRVLWTAMPAGDGPMRFAGDLFAVHYFRYLFGFDPAGRLVWAYSNPRVELVAGEHTGNAVVGVSASGDIVALDPATGGLRSRHNLGTSGQVMGATFDADGWNPEGPNFPVDTVPALVAIAHDRDARFDKAKELAISALATLPGEHVTRELIAVLGDKRQPARLKETVVSLLIDRRDPEGLPALVAELGVHADFIAGTFPELLAPVLRAIAALRGATIAPARAASALAALTAHLEDPATSPSELALVIDAMAAIGTGGERSALASHLLAYRADAEVGADPSWQKAIAAGLYAKGGPLERELLRQVAQDTRSQPGLVAAIRDVLANE